MLNTDFGFINQVLGVNIPWLNDPWLARFSVLMVNLWLGFPYFFLVCSGALTAIPADLKEAAFVDGASGRYAFRTVVLPLLLVATAPLLVTTFAFNFNNYTLIQLLTGGGPFPGTLKEGGSTDLLINFTYRVGVQRDQPAARPGLGDRDVHLRHRRDRLGLRLPPDPAPRGDRQHDVAPSRTPPKPRRATSQGRAHAVRPLDRGSSAGGTSSPSSSSSGRCSRSFYVITLAFSGGQHADRGLPAGPEGPRGADLPLAVHDLA